MRRRMRASSAGVTKSGDSKPAAKGGTDADETVKASAFHRRFSIVPDGGVRVRTGPVTAKEPDIWHLGCFT